jgi:hypothetical protein
MQPKLDFHRSPADAGKVTPIDPAVTNETLRARAKDVCWHIKVTVAPEGD